MVSKGNHPQMALVQVSEILQGLVNVPFWEDWTSPEIVAIKKTIYLSWLGDVQWGHLMTYTYTYRYRYIYIYIHNLTVTNNRYRNITQNQACFYS